MTFMILAATGLLLAALERMRRLRFRSAPLLRPYFATDTVYLLTGYVVGGSLALAYITAGGELVGTWLGLPRLAALRLPLWVSVPLALLALDLGNYVAHWLLHRVDALWELHKIHHSSRTLDWLATFRSHLLEQVLRRLLAPIVLIACGFPLDVVALAGALFTSWAMLNHSNLHLRLGILEAVLVTPHLHRLHHLSRTTERNLGTVFTLWDRLRGTLVQGEPAAACAFGFPGQTDVYPQRWLWQLAEPARGVLGRWRVPERVRCPRKATAGAALAQPAGRRRAR